MLTSQVRTMAVVSTLCALLLTSACSSAFVKSLGDLARLRQQLIDKYHEQDVNVTLNNSRFLSIAFINSPLNQKDPAVRAQRAQETAKLVVSNYPEIRKIENIWVSFSTSETRFIIFHYSYSIDVFAFDNTGALMNLNRREEADARTPVARFNAARNETDVSVTRLQLQGDLNHGIALVPHFTVAGKVNDPSSKVVAPAAVEFDFASYADKKLFSGNTKLEIHCDGRLILLGYARLLTPQDSGSEGSTAQFLTAQIPFRQFSRIGNAQEVTIKLGEKQFELSPEAIRSLHTMSEYAPQPHDETQ